MNFRIARGGSPIVSRRLNFFLLLLFCLLTMTNIPKSRRYSFVVTCFFTTIFECRNGLQMVTIEPSNSLSAIFMTILIFSEPYRTSWYSLVYRILKTKNSRDFRSKRSKMIRNTTLPLNFIQESFHMLGVGQTLEPPRCSLVMVVPSRWELSCGRPRSER